MTYPVPEKTGPKFPQVKVRLPKNADISKNVDAIAVLRTCRQAMEDAGLSHDEVMDFIRYASRSGKAVLLATCEQWFTVE